MIELTSSLAGHLGLPLLARVVTTTNSIRSNQGLLLAARVFASSEEPGNCRSLDRLKDSADYQDYLKQKAKNRSESEDFKLKESRSLSPNSDSTWVTIC